MSNDLKYEIHTDIGSGPNYTVCNGIYLCKNRTFDAKMKDCQECLEDRIRAIEECGNWT
jgi:hypothetical protein